MKLRESGKVDASTVVKDLTKSPRKVTKYVKGLKKVMKSNNVLACYRHYVLCLFTKPDLVRLNMT